MSIYVRYLLGVTLIASSLFVLPPLAKANNDICLMDSPTGRKTKPMLDCKYMEPFPGAGGKMVRTDDNKNWLFKATRYRVSDQMDYNNTVAYYSAMKRQSFVNEKSLYRRHIYNAKTGAYELPKVYAGVRVNAGTTTVTPIDAWNVCRYVQNNSDKDILVPFRTEEEWANFRSEAPASFNGQVVLYPCALPCSGECEANGFFYGPTSMEPDAGDVGLDEGSQLNYFPTELPYYPAGFLWPADAYDGVVNRHTFNYQCKYRTVENRKCVQEGTKDSFNKCTDPAADNKCCLKYTSQCVDRTARWTEVWQLDRPRAGEATLNPDGTRSNGWTWPSAGDPPYNSHSYKVHKLSTSRPAVCGTGLDLIQIKGGECLVPPPDPNAAPDADPKPKKKGGSSGRPGPHVGGGGHCRF